MERPACLPVQGGERLGGNFTPNAPTLGRGTEQTPRPSYLDPPCHSVPRPFALGRYRLNGMPVAVCREQVVGDCDRGIELVRPATPTRSPDTQYCPFTHGPTLSLAGVDGPPGGVTHMPNSSVCSGSIRCSRVVHSLPANAPSDLRIRLARCAAAECRNTPMRNHVPGLADSVSMI